jgi:SPP1 family predicted phage head-tail adaptor
MKVGRLRHRVIVQESVVSQDSDGAVEESWEQVGNHVSAEITALSGREFIAAAAIQAGLTTRIKVRHRPGYKPAMRVLHRQTAYNIAAVVPDPDSGVRFCVFWCGSGVNEG